MPTEKLPATFAALADPTRLALVERLMQGEATVAELALPFPLTQPAISRHLKVLEEAGLVESRVDGPARPRRLRPEALVEAADFLDRLRALWEPRFSRLDALLETLQGPKERRR